MARPQDRYTDEQREAALDESTAPIPEPDHELNLDAIPATPGDQEPFTPRAHWAGIFAAGLKELLRQRHNIDLMLPSNQVGTIVLHLREPLSLARRTEPDPGFRVVDSGLGADSEETWQATLEILTSPPKARDDRRVQERGKPKSSERSEPAELREVSLPPARLTPQEAADVLRAQMGAFPADLVYDIAAEALTALTRVERKTRMTSERFGDPETSLDALQTFHKRVVAFTLLPGLAPTNAPILERAKRDLAREFETLLVRLEDLTTRTIEEKRAVVSELNWCKRKLGLEFVWSDDGKACSLAVSSHGETGYWRVTRGRSSLTERIAFPRIGIKRPEQG